MSCGMLIISNDFRLLSLCIGTRTTYPKPSWLQTTLAEMSPKRSLQTVPHVSLWNTSRRPSRPFTSAPISLTKQRQYSTLENVATKVYCNLRPPNIAPVVLPFNYDTHASLSWGYPISGRLSSHQNDTHIKFEVDQPIIPDLQRFYSWHLTLRSELHLWLLDLNVCSVSADSDLFILCNISEIEYYADGLKMTDRVISVKNEKRDDKPTAEIC